MEELRDGYGAKAYPCDCGDDECNGWQMLMGDARKEYEYAAMKGKSPLQLTGAELKEAWSMPDYGKLYGDRDWEQFKRGATRRTQMDSTTDPIPRLRFLRGVKHVRSWSKWREDEH